MTPEEGRTIGRAADEPKPQTIFQLGNHLGSAVVELTAAGELITYEEYFPYGGTSLLAGRSEAEASAKEVRYSGQEKGSSTGLFYYTAV